LKVTGSIVDIYVLEKPGVPKNAPVKERIGGFEMELMESLSKQLGFTYDVKIALLNHFCNICPG